LAALIALLVLIGFASGCMIIGFAFAKESVPGRLGGTASGIANMGVMVGPMLLQPAVGWLRADAGLGRDRDRRAGIGPRDRSQRQGGVQALDLHAAPG
jgi:MFS family permease